MPRHGLWFALAHLRVVLGIVIISKKALKTSIAVFSLVPGLGSYESRIHHPFF